jgi:cellulose synthase/poly-beta-1,6-N-acetylglucosamine synthase-like glycosyltransferase
MIAIIITLVFLFLIINVLFINFLAQVSTEINTFNSYLYFSIIIAAKNEENNISSLINSLQKLDYPKDYFEVIIVDDDSFDKTYKIAEGLIQQNSNFNLYKVEKKEFPAKKGALNFGIKNAKNPFILITDADCLPEKDWLKFYSEKFRENYDFVFGVAPFMQDKSFLNKISCFENLRNSILSFAAAKIGISYSALARNFGFKKSSFKKIKGYSNTTETLSGDDDLLLREAVKNKLKIGTITGKRSFVFSSTKNNYKEYFIQKTRHIKTSFYYLPGRQLFLAFWHLTNLFFLFSPLLIFFNKLFCLLLLGKILTDFLIVKFLQKKFGYNFNNFEIIYLQAVYELFLIIHFFNALFKKDKWK